MINEQNRKKITEKIAYHLSEERKQKGVYGTSEHEFVMAEMELMNYELFIEKYGYITEIIKSIK